MDLNVSEIISDSVIIGKNVHIGYNVIIEDNVVIEDNVYIDNNCIIRRNVTIGCDAHIGANCILGEYLMDFCQEHKIYDYSLVIGEHAIIRSGSIIYTNSCIGNHFQTGHNVVIRERSAIGNHVSVGTLCDIQGNCMIGNYVRLHSNVHVGQLSRIDDYVWIFPYVVLTNDPTPPSEHLLGVHVKSFAIVATGSVILPGTIIGEDSLVAAGAIVTKDVEQYMVVGGNPAKILADIRNVKNKVTGELAYPWRYHFKRNMPWEGSNYEEWYTSLSLNN